MVKYDIHFQGVPPAEVVGFKIITFGFTMAEKVTGPQALVNRWLKTFVTPKGTDPSDLNEGTSFGQLFGITFSDIQDLKDLVFLAITDANDQVKQQDIEGMYTLNERLQDAALIDILLDEGTSALGVWIRITNMAGETLSVKLMLSATR